MAHDKVKAWAEEFNAIIQRQIEQAVTIELALFLDALERDPRITPEILSLIIEIANDNPPQLVRSSTDH